MRNILYRIVIFPRLRRAAIYIYINSIQSRIRRHTYWKTFKWCIADDCILTTHAYA